MIIGHVPAFGRTTSEFRGSAASPLSALWQAARRHFTTSAQKGLIYRPDIDGLRAVAVLSVVFFHLGSEIVTGGFVGVDVFFVISGYLITLTIIEDLRRGTFTLVRFYERRMRRIFPALFAMSASCALAAAVLFTPKEMKGFGENLIAMALFVSNIFQRYAGARGGYFNDDSQSNLLLHTWSLSVEEQFYILLPLLMGWLIARKKPLLPWLAGLGAVSLVLSVVWTEINAKEAFYFVATRAWEFLAGSLLVLVSARQPLSRPLRELVAALGLVLIALGVFAYSRTTAFPGLAALPPCLGALMIIYTGEQGKSTVGALLSSKPFVVIGAISYSLYLWHWPVILFAQRITLIKVGDMSASAVTVIFVVSLVLAGLSYVLVEQPFRRYKVLFSRRRLFLMGGLASAGAVALGFGIVASDGLAARYASGHSIIGENLARMSEIPTEDQCANWQNPAVRTSDIYTCPLGPDRPKKILFWGDSHVDTIRPLVNELFHTGGLGDRGAFFMVSNGCPPVIDMKPAEADFPHCNAFTSKVQPRALEDDIDTVFIGFAGGWWDQGLCLSKQDVCERFLPLEEQRKRFLSDLRTTFADLERHGKHVVLELPWPAYAENLPKYEINRFRFASWGLSSPTILGAFGLLGPVPRNDYAAFRRELVALAKEYGVVTFDPRPALCPDDRCVYEKDHVSLYADNDHIATSQLAMFADDLKTALAKTEGRTGK